MSTPGDPITEFLAHFKLSKYEKALRDNGLEDLSLLKDLTNDDVEGIAKESGLTVLHRKKLVKAVDAVKNGKYAVSCEEDQKDDVKEGEGKGLTQLQKSRTHLKGFQDVKTDKPDKSAKNLKKNRTIVLIGQTGAGKTTLINSMMNFLYQVGYDENVRYQLINEKKDKSIAKNTTKSQTRKITPYHLKECPAISHSLTIIDTPGFGDTSGIERDVEIRNLFKDFFQDVPELDAIYFVVKSSETRLSATQTYIFDMVLNVFGENVKNNMFILFTFADGADPPALKQIQELKIPFEATFKINNSGFTLPKTDIIHKSYYTMGIEQYRLIFDALNQVQTVSTKQTVQVLRERDNLRTWLFNIGQDVKIAMDKIEEAHKTYVFLKANEKKIEANAKFEIPRVRWVKKEDPIPSGTYTTHCIKCITTCHESCGISDDSKKYKCWAMKDGICTQCIGKCDWNDHKNVPYKIRREKEEYVETLEDMAKEYNVASQAKDKCKIVMKEMLSDIEKREERIRKTIVRMKESINRLKQIALNKNVLTDDQYFDQLIEAERMEKKPGYNQRIKQLQNMKKNNSLLKNYTEGKEEPISWKNNENLKKYKEEIQQMPSSPSNDDDAQSEDNLIDVKVGDWQLKIGKKNKKKSKKSGKKSKSKKGKK